MISSGTTGDIKDEALLNPSLPLLDTSKGGKRLVVYAKKGDTGETARALKDLGLTMPVSRSFLWNCLQLASPLSDGMNQVVVDLRAHGQMNDYMPALLDKHGVSPKEFLEMYQRGHAVLSKIEMDIRMTESLPAIASDLARHAVDVIVPCGKCGGLGREVVKGEGDAALSALPKFPPCKRCGGKGRVKKSSRFKKWATQQVLLATKVIEPKGGGPTVNVSNQTAVLAGGQAGFFAKMLEAADEVLYPKRVQDAPKVTVVESEPSR